MITLYLSPHGYNEPVTPVVAFPLYAMDYLSQLEWVDNHLNGGVAHSHSSLPMLRLKSRVRKGKLKPSDVQIHVWSGPGRGWTFMELDEEGDFYEELPHFWQENSHDYLSYREIFS